MSITYSRFPIEAEGKQPGAKTLARLIRQAKAEGIKVIFVQEQFDDAQADAHRQGDRWNGPGHRSTGRGTICKI